MSTFSQNKAETTATYATQYQILRETAERLRTGGPEDIDNLIEDFRRATQAYDYCRARIEQIQHELDAEMNRNRQPYSTPAAPEEPPLF